MSEVTLQADVRTNTGKKTRRTRQSGKIPGIFYAHNDSNIAIEATIPGLKPIIYTSKARLIDLQLSDGVQKTCILKDVQFDPVTDLPVHFDLQGINAEEELTIEVPVILVGSPKGVKDGGMMQHIMHKLKVSCLPKFIPDHVEIDVTELGINDSIHVSEMKIENVRLLDNSANTIVAVVPPTVLKEETPAEAVAVPTSAEPEVISKGKKLEEGEEAAPKKEEKK